MTKDQIILLSQIKNIDHFYMILDSISRQYESQLKSYDHLIKSKSYIESNNNIPKSLFKYIDIDGGIASIENSNIQFSHPLSFRHHNSSMGDFSEFWYEKRFHIDKKAIMDFIKELELLFNKKINSFEAFNLFLYQFVMNTVERNKVLCLSKESDNIHLYTETNKTKGSICIEYKSDLFKNKNNLTSSKKHFNIIYNEVSYVDQIIEYPIRFEPDKAQDWLSNFLFIKESKYKAENEFRIIYTIDYMDDYRQSNRDEKFKYAYNRLIGKDMGNISPLRINIDRKFINHVYYTSNVIDEKPLLSVLEKHNIPYTKLTVYSLTKKFSINM